MSNLVKSSPAMPSTFEDVIRLGDIFRRSGYFKNVNDEAQAVTKILYGQELGFSPVVSMMGIYIVDGKPALSGNLLGALVKRSGRYDYVVKTMTNDGCAIEFFQIFQGSRSSIGVSTFTLEDAKMARLVDNKDNWKKYPKAMLFNRALSAGVRAFCPDVAVASIYVPEELGADVNEDGDVVSISETPAPYIAEPVVLTGTPVVPPPTSETEEEVKEAVQEAIGFDEPVFIDNRRRSNIARRFRESLKPELQPDDDKLRHKALTALHFSGLFKSKFLDDNGNPTSEFILMNEYEQVGKMMVQAAKSLQ